MICKGLVALLTHLSFAEGAVPVEIVVVVARQRSGSTFMAASIEEELKRDPSLTVRNIGEPWLAGSPFNREYDRLVNWTRTQRMLNPLGFLHAMQSALCRRATRCVLVVKLFDIHFLYADGNWRCVVPDELVPLFSHPAVRLVVVEREPNDEMCSLTWAEKTNQWWRPSTPQEVRAAYETFKRTNCSITSPQFDVPTFAYQHASWFRVVHEAVRRSPGATNRSVHVSYAEHVSHHGEVMARIRNDLLRPL
jgi:hypothetical protein